MRRIHKYKCLFYQTNAYQTTVIACSAHNKGADLFIFILWALSSTVEIKNIFSVAIHVSLYKPLPAAVKISWEILSLWRLDFMEGLYHSALQQIASSDYMNLATKKTTEKSFLCCLNSQSQMSHDNTI